MTSYKLYISPQVERDLTNILFYMKELDAYEQNIHDFLDSIYTIFELIQITTLMGTTLETKVDIPTNIRFFVVENHIIFYEVVGNVINVYRIISDRQDYIAMLELN